MKTDRFICLVETIDELYEPIGEHANVARFLSEEMDRNITLMYAGAYKDDIDYYLKKKRDIEAAEAFRDMVRWGGYIGIVTDLKYHYKMQRIYNTMQNSESEFFRHKLYNLDIETYRAFNTIKNIL